MKLKKVVLLVLTIGLIYGCSFGNSGSSSTAGSNKTAVELYKGLDAKETYKKACDYFNETVTYVKEITVEDTNTENPGVTYGETYLENGKRSGAIKWISKYFSQFIVFKDGKYYQQIHEDVVKLTDEQQKELYDERQKVLLKPLLESSESKYEKIEIVDIAKTNQGDDIVVAVKYKKRTPIYEGESEVKGWNDETYEIKETYINKNGLIYKTVGRMCDKNFNNGKLKFTSEMSDFNSKKSLSYEDEVADLKKYEGMSVEQFKKELGI